MRISVGGDPLEDIRFGRGGEITGTLSRMPATDDVVVELGALHRRATITTR